MVAVPLRVTVAIVNYNSGGSLLPCLSAVGAPSAAVEIIVVDNSSTDGSDRIAAEWDGVRLLRQDNVGFAAACNRAAEQASGDVLIFLNPDVTLSAGAIQALAARVSDGSRIAGPALVVGEENSIEYGGVLDLTGMPRGLAKPAKPLYVPGCALAISRSAFHSLDGMDERFFLFSEDVELCWRALVAGLDVEVLPDHFARHLGGGSTPGGYTRGGRLEMSQLRLTLRERNTLATALQCGSIPLLLLLVPVLVTKTAVLAMLAAILRRPALAAELMGGLRWNARELPRTLRRRRSIRRSRAGSREAGQRIARKVFAVAVLRRYGMPRLLSSE